jgi:hypothetical protein
MFCGVAKGLDIVRTSAYLDGKMVDGTESVGAALARIRWAKASETERRNVGRMLLNARRRKGKAESKRARKAAAKS